MPESTTKSLTLSSNFEEIQRLESFVHELQEWTGFDDDFFSNIMLALSEAATNAIVHGNQQDESKKVYIEANVEDGHLIISIKDEGEGFDPSNLPNPLQDKNLLKEGGRGVYLIKQYADKVNYSKGGTKVTIEFEI